MSPASARQADRRDEAADGCRPLRGLLDRVERRLSTDAIDTLWIFPPRRVGDTETRVAVVSAFDDDGERRRVFTARYRLRDGGDESDALEHAVTEQASAPVDRIDRIISGVLRRLDDDLADAPPRTIAIRGDASRWTTLLDSLGAHGPTPAG